MKFPGYLAGGLAVQTLDGGLFGRPVTRYLYHDHLGSIVRVADANGALVEGADYGPFGERRGFAHPTGIPAIPETTNKGFTGHEMLDGLDIVHMNGRLYDNRLYRFMQPDPFVQSPGTPQNWNPYSYLWNNPLNGTDPSGYLGVKERQWLGAIIVVVAIVTQQYWLGANAGAGATFAYAVSVGAIAGGVSSGSWEGALWGAFSAAVFYGIGSAFDQVAQANNLAEQKMHEAWFSNYQIQRVGASSLTGGQYAAKTLMHGIAGGAMSSLQGGKFGHGFVSAGAAQGASTYIDGIPGATGRVAAAALLGGSVSAMTGGKFASGAMTAAFSRAFNDEAHNSALKIAREGTDAWAAEYVGSTDFHENETLTYVCSLSQNGCSYQSVRNRFNSESVPGMIGKPTEGAHMLNGFPFKLLPGIPVPFVYNNPIRHFRPSDGLAINETLSGHDFHPGRVINFTFVHREGVYIYTRGVGAGANPSLNNFVGDAWSQVTHQSIRNRTQGYIRARDAWGVK